MQQRVDEQLVDVPSPQIKEEVVEEFNVVPQEQFSEGARRQIVDVPVPQVVEQLVLVPSIMEEIRSISNDNYGTTCGGDELSVTEKRVDSRIA